MGPDDKLSAGMYPIVTNTTANSSFATVPAYMTNGTPTWYDQDFKIRQDPGDLPPKMVAITACLTCGLDEVNCDCDVCRCEFCVREDCTCLMETTTADVVEVDEDPLDVLIRKAGVPDLGDLYMAAGQAGLITLTVDYE